MHVSDDRPANGLSSGQLLERLMEKTDRLQEGLARIEEQLKGNKEDYTRQFGEHRQIIDDLRREHRQRIDNLTRQMEGLSKIAAELATAMAELSRKALTDDERYRLREDWKDMDAMKARNEKLIEGRMLDRPVRYISIVTVALGILTFFAVQIAPVLHRLFGWG